MNPEDAAAFRLLCDPKFRYTDAILEYAEASPTMQAVIYRYCHNSGVEERLFLVFLMGLIMGECK